MLQKNVLVLRFYGKTHVRTRLREKEKWWLSTSTVKFIFRLFLSLLVLFFSLYLGRQEKGGKKSLSAFLEKKKIRETAVIIRFME